MRNLCVRACRGRSLHVEQLENRRMLAADPGGTGDDTGYLGTDPPAQIALGDLNRDGYVDVADVSPMIGNWGKSIVGYAKGDVNQDGIVDAADWRYLSANWTESTEIATPVRLDGDLNEDGLVDAADFGTIIRNWGKSGLTYSDGDVNRDGIIDVVDWNSLTNNWTGGVTDEDPIVQANIFYWPEHTPTGHSRLLKLSPFSSDNVNLNDVGMWLENNGWTREGPNAVLLTMGSWQEIQTTELFKGPDGTVTVESIAQHVLDGMQNWERAKSWWEGYLQEINNAGYEVNLVAMDIEAGIPYTGMKYSPPNGPEITMLEVINYLYSNQQWSADLPAIDLEALNQPNPINTVGGRQALLEWNHWVAEKSAQAWTDVFAEAAKAVFPEVIVNNFDYSSYEGDPLLDRKSFLPRANASVDGNSSPVLYLQDDYGYRTVEQALAAFDIVRGEGDQPHTIVPWIGGPYREGAEGWHVTQDNFQELKKELLKRGVPYLLVF